MANDTKFTHISVTVDDDDDFVIEAGSPVAAPAGVEPAEPASQAVGFEPASAPAAAPAAGPAAPASVPAAAPAIAPAAASGSANQKPATKGYRETTLDDLEGEKMSGMQKGVIAAALVAIIVFVVYLVL